jgi:hypothetical protein
LLLAHRAVLAGGGRLGGPACGGLDEAEQEGQGGVHLDVRESEILERGKFVPQPAAPEAPGVNILRSVNRLTI